MTLVAASVFKDARSRILADGSKDSFAASYDREMSEDVHSLSAQANRYLALQLYACLWYDRLACCLVLSARKSKPTQRYPRSGRISHVFSTTEPLTAVSWWRLVSLGFLCKQSKET